MMFRQPLIPDRAPEPAATVLMHSVLLWGNAFVRASGMTAAFPEECEFSSQG